MKIDKDNINSWKPYSPQLCKTCIATCCTMPVEVKAQDLVRLGFVHSDDLENKKNSSIAKDLKKQGLVKSYRESTELFMLESRPNGDCVLLDPVTRLCSNYENRPQTCRQFPTEIGRRPKFCPYIKK